MSSTFELRRLAEAFCYHNAIVAQVLIRQLEEDVVEALKTKAKANGRSLEAELREILKSAASDPWQELLNVREALSGRSYSDSSELTREAPRK